MIKFLKLSFLLVAFSVLISSCGTKLKFIEIGKLTISSTKNVDLKGEHILLSRNAGFDDSQVSVINKKEQNKKARKKILANYEMLKATSVDKAMENVVEQTPGGIYMENVEIYLVNTRKIRATDFFFIVSGDVFGVKDAVKQIRGFTVGTKAFYKKESGTVITLLDDKYCLWQSDKSDAAYTVLYDQLIKIGD